MKTYVCSDLHGYYNIFLKIDDFLEEQHAKCICLGDNCDRGPDGYQIIKHMLANEDKYAYLKGNHEQLFVDAALEIKDIMADELLSSTDFSTLFEEYATFHNISLHVYNGGRSTLKAWLRDGAPMNIIDRLARLPVKKAHDGYMMCHSGCHNKEWMNAWSQKDDVYIWNRSHFKEKWDGVKPLIHGHTPVQVLADDKSREEIYQYNNKVDIDICTAYSGKAALYCLDNNTVVYF